jgi:2-hydroxychromene-2-carboxylate isomerase
MTDAANRWYFDFISPFAYLQWPKVRALMQEHTIQPVPILLAAVLDARGQKGPAEIPSKREFTYRHVLWQARAAGVPLRFPPKHPFNPLPALRLCIAAGASPTSIDAIYDWIWVQGRAADTLQALEPVREALGLPAGAADSAEAKAMLRNCTEIALTAGSGCRHWHLAVRCFGETMPTSSRSRSCATRRCWTMRRCGGSSSCRSACSAAELRWLSCDGQQMTRHQWRFPRQGDTFCAQGIRLTEPCRRHTRST